MDAIAEPGTSLSEPRTQRSGVSGEPCNCTAYSASRLGPYTVAFIALLLVTCPLFLYGLADRELISSHEARAGQNAQMVLDTGDWLLPRLLDGHVELQKPPMYYWMVAAIGWLNGGHVDAWAIRLPAALSALACVLFLYLLGVQCRRPVAGLVAALVLASSLHFTWLARVGRIDMPLTAAITVALGCFHVGTLDGKCKWKWHGIGYAAIAIGILLKGPIAIFLPALVVVAAVYLGSWDGSPEPSGRVRRPVLRGSSLGWGIPLMMLLAAPWFVWANVRTDNQFFETFFWFHNVERGLGSEVLKAHPWWFYFAHAPFDLLPWTLVVPVAMIYMLRKPELRGDLALRLGLIWFGAVFVFLSCMSFKRADYLLPAFPGLAIFLGACAEAWWRQDHSDRARRFAVSGLGAVLAMCIAGWLVHTTWFLSAEERDWPYRRMAAEIRQQTTGAVVFFQAESHPLAFHLGHPVTTVLEWENLQWWCDRDKPIYIVMPEATAAEWRAHLGSEALVEVLHSSDFLRSSHPIAVFRNRGKPPANP